MASTLALLRLHVSLFLPQFQSTALLPPQRRPSLLPVFSTLSSASTVKPDHYLTASYPYGPSLRKGLPRHPLPSPGGDGNGEIYVPTENLDKEQFVRVFEVAALRVPAAGCAALEARLRGHLLNWPRVRNVARVPGDDIDPEVAGLLRESGGGGKHDRLVHALRRARGEDEGEAVVLNPLLYREKLVKEFNRRGFLKFRNLAKMSRPKNKKRSNRKEKEEREGGELGIRRGKNDFSIVEVLRDCNEEDKEEGLGRLLGNDFARGRWTGPTRLLLLDERHANKGAEELPEAVKAILFEDVTLGMQSKCELVQCRLTLFYEYWSMNEILEELLPNDVIVPTAFETVGHIAHLNLRDEHLPYKKLIAQVVLDKNRPRIQTVVNKIDVIQNDYRTMQLEILAGNHSLVTTVVENGIRFHVNLATVYWNSRLATERQRLICNFAGNDVICKCLFT